MIAYHGDATVKAKLLDGLAAHRASDAIVKGQYWRNGKGCAVGCTIKTMGGTTYDDHAQYETLIGVPQMIARLEDSIFEALPISDALLWPERFAQTITPGADLALVGWQFLDRLLLRAFARIDAQSPVHAACQPALQIVSAKSRGEVVSRYATRVASDAAGAARYATRVASDAAWAASDAARVASDVAWAASDAARVASDVAWAASYATRAASDATRVASDAAWTASDAAWAASDAAGAASYAAGAASDAAGAAEVKQQADDLCELFAAAPMVSA